jgi:hypothetical protein
MVSMGQDSKAKLPLWLNKHNDNSLEQKSQTCSLPVNFIWHLADFVATTECGLAQN